MVRKPASQTMDPSSFPKTEIIDAIGQSREFLQFQERLSHAARVNRSVLLIGERGTGKELAASRLHFLSNRWQAPLVTLNCAALAPTLIESELFGYEAGAFTGATARRVGRFELADGGTLFLDEIGSIPMQVQEKILRVVEYGTFERVGSSEPVQVDVRIIGATNADLVALSEDGRFKRDLLDRLSFDVLFLPPLRERLSDIPILANHFASRMAFELGWELMPEFSDESLQALEEYSWPGNVRELKNVVERAVYQSPSNVIFEIVFDPFAEKDRSPLPPLLRGVNPGTPLIKGGRGDSLTPLNKGGSRVDLSLSERIRQVEIESLRESLEQARHNQKIAAELLGIRYHQFRWLMRKYRKEILE